MPIQLIVGLGNPGVKYANTRHNAGAWFVEQLADTAKCSLRSENKFHGLHALATFLNSECHLLIPTTYMNKSGSSIRALATFYKIPYQNILIAHDELDLPIGITRLKYDGGAGGHNGLTDTIDHLHTKKFYRLRIGIGRPQNSKVVADYVLTPPSRAEQQAIYRSLQQAQEILPLLLEDNFSQAMQILHTSQTE